MRRKLMDLSVPSRLERKDLVKCTASCPLDNGPRITALPLRDVGANWAYPV